jgi:hypothetical protein
MRNHVKPQLWGSSPRRYERRTAPGGGRRRPRPRPQERPHVRLSVGTHQRMAKLLPPLCLLAKSFSNCGSPCEQCYGTPYLRNYWGTSSRYKARIARQLLRPASPQLRTSVVVCMRLYRGPHLAAEHRAEKTDTILARSYVGTCGRRSALACLRKNLRLSAVAESCDSGPA